MRIAVIVSGVRGGTWLIPVIGTFVYFSFRQYRSKAQQIHTLQSNSQRSLIKQFRESIEGSRHIRAFGRASDNYARSLALLGNSQVCLCSSLQLQNWLSMIFDLNSAMLVTVLLAWATSQPSSSSLYGIAVSFWSLLCLSHALRCLNLTFTRTEKQLNSASELVGMLATVPREHEVEGTGLPAHWPERGDVRLSDVTARYG